MFKCSNCLWCDTDQCDGVSDCRSYSPIIEEVSDKEAEALVEEGRKEYDDAWRSYIRNFYFS